MRQTVAVAMDSVAVAASEAQLPDLSMPETSPQPTQSQPGSGASPMEEGCNPGSTKRRRACEGCRRLKVQCHYDLPKSETCKRCTRAGRRCVVTERRRRQAITSTAVSELEKKLAALTASLDAIKAGSVLRVANAESPTQEAVRNDLQDESPPIAPKRQASGNSVGIRDQRIPSTSAASFTDQEPGLPVYGRGAFQESSPQGQPRLQNDMKDYIDVIDRGILPSSAAFAAFDHFLSNMLPHFPIVVFPPDAVAAVARTKAPVLFLAAVNAASGILGIEVQRELNRELMRLFADRILMIGEKSLELVQAVQIASIWHYPPARYEELKYYQLIHSACIMAIDIGLNRRGKAAISVGLTEPVRERPSQRPDPSHAVSRRAWLGCYFLAAQTAQNLRRDNVIRWSSYMEECLKVLEVSPQALDSDQLLCQWIRLQHIADDISIQFSIEDLAACEGLDDPKMRFAIQGFEGQLRACNACPIQVPKPANLKLGESITRLFLHEVALHAGYSNDDMQPPFTEEALKSKRPTQAARLSAEHISSLSTSLSVIHTLFDTFLSIPVHEIRSFPTFQFVRIVYAAIVLTKMAYDATVPDSEAGRMFNRDDFKIDHYFDKLVAFLRAAAEGDRCASATKFSMVLFVMKALLHKQTGERLYFGTNGQQATGKGRQEKDRGQNLPQDSVPPSGSALEWQNHRPSQTSSNDSHFDSIAEFGQPSSHSSLPESQPMHTSLHVLSEVAAGERQSSNYSSASVDHFMNDIYDFDPQNFDLNGENLPDFFSDDGLLSSVLHVAPGGFFDSWSNPQ